MTEEQAIEYVRKLSNKKLLDEYRLCVQAEWGTYIMENKVTENEILRRMGDK